MVLQAVQLGIVAVAPAQLYRHAAVAVIGNLLHLRQVLEQGLLGDIGNRLTLGGLCQRLQQSGNGVLHTVYDLAVGMELRIKYGIDFHGITP